MLCCPGVICGSNSAWTRLWLQKMCREEKKPMTASAGCEAEGREEKRAVVLGMFDLSEFV